ncbi:MAG: hypothetical protein MZV70_01825 [Desulfobacterales bacterium]|nr:hypothetical protein [Desulfobacterales bacterium]
MKRTLILVRHAKSSWDGIGLPDTERPRGYDRPGKRDAPMMRQAPGEAAGETRPDRCRVPRGGRSATARNHRQANSVTRPRISSRMTGCMPPTPRPCSR